MPDRRLVLCAGNAAILPYSNRRRDSLITVICIEVEISTVMLSQ
jgi:hypothetical protein